MKSPIWFLWILAVGVVWSGKAIALQGLSYEEAVKLTATAQAPDMIKGDVIRVLEDIRNIEKKMDDFVVRCAFPEKALRVFAEKLAKTEEDEEFSFRGKVHGHITNIAKTIDITGEIVREIYSKSVEGTAFVWESKKETVSSEILAALERMRIQREEARRKFISTPVSEKCTEVSAYSALLRSMADEQKRILGGLLKLAELDEDKWKHTQ